MNIALILGTARAERRSEAVFSSLAEVLETAGHEVSRVDVREHLTAAATIPAWGAGGADEEPTRWQQIAAAADAFVHVLPEYNHGYPGEWKLLVDQLTKEYVGKPAFLVGVSGGHFGGARVVEHVQPVLWELGFNTSTNVLYVSNAKDAIADGRVTDAALLERMQTFVSKIA